MFKAVAAFSGFSVNDTAKVKEFYTNTLGLELINEDMGMQLRLPGGGEVFVYSKPDHRPADYTMLNFVVENIDSAVDELVSAGVSFERYESMPGEQDERGIMRGLAAQQGPDIAWFKDPAGNILALLQPE